MYIIPKSSHLHRNSVILGWYLHRNSPCFNHPAMGGGQAVDRVCLAHGPDYESATTAFEDAAGPERFFYDKTTYTGGPGESWGNGQIWWVYGD